MWRKLKEKVRVAEEEAGSEGAPGSHAEAGRIKGSLKLRLIIATSTSVFVFFPSVVSTLFNIVSW